MRERRAREIQDNIRTVLVHDWNPIGFDVPRDEYDAYIGGVYRLLFQGASIPDIANHLASVESLQIGFDVTVESLHAIATKLQAIDIQIEADPTT